MKSNETCIQAEINTEFVRWLNNKTNLSNHNVVLVDGFCFILKKIQRQGSVRLTKEGYFHPRFWKSVDRTLNFKLLKPQKNNIKLVVLYQFCFYIMINEGFISINERKASITVEGTDFLQKQYHDQLDLLLSKIW